MYLINSAMQQASVNLYCLVLGPVFVHNPLAEVLPVLVPGLNVLSLGTSSVLAAVNILDPIIVRLVFEICPP